jgi:hypothetical protein
VQVAAEVDQALGAVDERGEQVRSDELDRQDVRLRGRGAMLVDVDIAEFGAVRQFP